MQIDLNSAEITLLENQLLRLNNARGLRIACTAGTVWITETGESSDTILYVGDQHEISGNGLALIEGLSSGRITLARRKRKGG